MSCIYKYKGKDYTKEEFYSLVSNSNFIQQEQTHILGSKKDIEGFKKFVTQPTTQSVKSGVPELFESNPELANEVYEALGFKNNLKTSLGKELEHRDPYISKNRLNDFKKYEVLDENSNNIGTVVIEYRGSKSVILHPKLNVTGKGYGKDLYKFVSSNLNVQIEEWNEGPISNSDAAKKMWNSLEKEGIAKRIFDEEEGDNFRVVKYNTQITPQQKQQAQQLYSQYIEQTGKQDIEGFKQFLKKDDESIYYKNLEDEIKVLEEDKIKIAEKRRNFREWMSRFTTLNEVKNDNQKLLESRRQVFKDLGFTETYDNTFELKTSSYVTLISKKQALDDNPLIRFDGKLTGVKYTQKSVDGTYILTYKLDDITKTSIREAQIKGEMPFTKSDLKETLKSEDFLNSVSENIFDGLSPEETQIIKEKLESGEYNINCKL